jgi:hypothetical protein
VGWIAVSGGGEAEAVLLEDKREAVRGEELVERVGVVPRERRGLPFSER